MQDTKRIWVWVGVAVVVIAVILFVVWRPSAKAPTATNTPVPVTYAPAGQLTPQFPKDLILDGMSNVTSSYSIAYSSSTNQYTAVFNASTSMAALYYSYEQYFLHNSWNITKLVTKFSDSRGIIAEDASSTASIAIVAQGSGSQVTISLATK